VAFVNALDGPHAAEKLIYHALSMQDGGILRVDLSRVQKVYPNGAVPFAAALAHFKRTGYRIDTGGASDEVRGAAVFSPGIIDDWDGTSHVTNRVWEYSTPGQANALTNALTRAIEDNVECGRGVIDSLTWCLFEVLDNVFQHSRAGSGFVMMQLHVRSRMAVVCVSDTGIGVLNSFRESRTNPSSDDYDALKKAVQERVTSKPKNMGNGLFGLIRVVGINGGRMEIRSGRGSLRYEDRSLAGEVAPSRPLIDSTEHAGTTVDWQLKLGNAVSLGRALATPRPTPARLESYEDEWDRIVLSVSDFEQEIGSRTGAEQIRTRLINAIADSGGSVILDFDGINVVSSSFADEVLGKLVLARGRKFLDAHVQFANANLTVLGIIERAIVQRVREGDLEHPAREVP